MKLLFILLLGLGFSQTELTTRVYDLGTINFTEGYEYELDLYSITGYDLDFAYITFGKITDISFCCNTMDIHLKTSYTDYDGVTQYRHHMIELMEGGGVNYAPPIGYSLYTSENPVHLRFWNGVGSASVSISVTAEFPEEDTGYIEEGFEFCLTPGANLLSFPCDSPINVGESLPQGVENFITEIVGQGVAASYNPALGWIGNLAEFTPGSGYWFKSNESLCFEYDCVED